MERLSTRSLPTLLLLLAPATSSATAASFRGRESLLDAVALWCANETLAIQTYGHISAWDVSRVTNMDLLFNDRFKFNADISRWDVSHVTTMNYMFDNARAFNQNIARWDVSQVTQMVRACNTMHSTRKQYSHLTRSLLRAQYAMFSGAAAFDQDLSRWDVSKVTHGLAPMRHMFREALSLSECNKQLLNEAWSANHKWPYPEWESRRNACPPRPPAPPPNPPLVPHDHHRRRAGQLHQRPNKP